MMLMLIAVGWVVASLALAIVFVYTVAGVVRAVRRGVLLHRMQEWAAWNRTQVDLHQRLGLLAEDAQLQAEHLDRHIRLACGGDR